MDFGFSHIELTKSLAGQRRHEVIISNAKDLLFCSGNYLQKMTKNIFFEILFLPLAQSVL
jgi:hypothetical protein